ncbi:trypsin-like peptidase domain-containing protein [Bacillaceae bacterium]
MGYYDGKETKRFSLWALVASFLAGVFFFGTVSVAVDSAEFFRASAAERIAEQAIVKEENGKEAAQAQNVASLVSPKSISQIVKEAGPAVVKIETIVKNRQGTRYNPFFNDPFFRDFFGDEFPFALPTPEMSRGMGSGFIISPDGYILTNEHVVSGADEILVEVTGHDKPYKAKLVGSDFDLDLAVLKIDAKGKLPTLKLGDSEQIEVGDWAIAIGNPYGLDHTVTVGVISAKGRPVDVQDRHYKNLLQTDASINPGNSGGPLLNLNGEVIGINTAVNAQAQGIGFAIPTSTVKAVLKNLIQDGKVTRPWLGVALQDVTPEIAEYFQMEEAKGTIVAQVVPGSPAEEAGLQRGDIILEFNKNPVARTEDLINLVQKQKVGDQAMLLVFRNGQHQYVTVKIGEKPNPSQ